MTDDDGKVASITSRHAEALAEATQGICGILAPIPRWLQPVVLRGILKGLESDDTIDDPEDVPGPFSVFDLLTETAKQEVRQVIKDHEERIRGDDPQETPE